MFDNTEKNRLKGVNHNYKQRNITHANFKDAFNGELIPSGEFYQIESKNHIIQTVKKSKSTIVFYNDKKHFISPTECFSFGHKSLKK